jgi:aryl sulfotransferase
MGIHAPSSDNINVLEDSRRWNHVVHRDDDIIISTPPKCGTTWTQGIVSSLLWQEGDAPGDLRNLGRWIDNRARPIESVAADVEAQTHRRFLKTHSPADTVPRSDSAKYVTVYRDAADALVSWGNHRTALRPGVWQMLNQSAGELGVEPIADRWDGDYDILFEEWSRYWSPVTHLASWWPLRREPNVLFVHYADLTADLGGQMRRIAAFLELEIREELWADVVDRCLLDSMRDQANQTSDMDSAFEGGATSFFHKGGNGRGRELLSGSQLQQCTDHAAETLPPEAARWLELGSIASGTLPDA